jgi:serine O-acetyltransferase
MNSVATLLKTIREDLTAHQGEWSRPGFQTLAVHRFGRWTKTIRRRPLRAVPSLLAKTANVFCRNFYGIELPFEASVGRGVVIEHQGSIVVHGGSVIGDGCILRQGVTLGCKSMDAVQDAPRLGDRVNVGCGAVILGNVSVGNDCIVGSNAVITKDVPPAVTVVGNNKWLDFDIQASSSFVDVFAKKYGHLS